MKRLGFLVLVMAAMVSACSGDDTPTGPSATSNLPFSTLDLRTGTGAEATTGRAVTVNYTGWLYSALGTDNKGTLFDSSLAAGRTPLVFTIGAGNIIPGFSQGTVGMRVGGLRRVVMPPSVAYGSAGSGTTIPPNATLIFEIELLAVQ
jgi:FKBP-type peptidyl-prolyl cis-trans isomerase FkpA